MISIDITEEECAVTVKEIVETGCYSFEGILDFNEEPVIERIVSVMEREDGAAGKIMSYGLCCLTGIYILGSIIRVLV